MSSPQDPILEGVMHLANFLARQLARGVVDDLTSETGQRLAGGLGPGEVAQARLYAGRAEDLRIALANAPPGTHLVDLPEYAALGSTPKLDILRVYGEGDLADELRAQLGAAPPGTTIDALRAYRDRPEDTDLEYRISPFLGGPYFSAEFAGEIVEGEEMEGFGPSSDSGYIGFEIEAIVPFDLYAPGR